MNRLKVTFDLPEDASLAVKKALDLEAQGELMRKSSVSVSVGDGVLVLDVEAPDLHGLRASLNTYMRWIIMLTETIEVAK
ncbi:MAG: KEOPS complex subunit Pcc1 [Candidatus Altiarchaeota archaeon]